MEEITLDEKEETQLNKKKPGVKKNYFYNLSYQIFLLIIPLITTPYVSRILLADGVGKYSFSVSLITYFTIFAALGFGYYAQREIAKHQNDIKRQTEVFWEINICRLIPVSIALVTNIILCSFNVYKGYNLLMWILNINIITIAFDINYFFQGNENFKSIIIRNFVIKALALASIFIFVKKENDVWVYTLINSASAFLSMASMWVPIRKLIVKINFKEIKPFRHLKDTLILFLPTIAVSIYTILDKTLIGVLIKDTYTALDENGNEIIKKYSDLENGYYEQTEKIVKMIMTIITSIGIVMIPRNSNEFASGNYDKVVDNIKKTSMFVLFIGIPMTLGLIVASDLIVPWFFGDGFDKCKTLIKIMSPLILIIGFSNVFGLQFLIPSGRDKEFTVALIIGAVTNLALNLVFINFWWSIGAAIATIVAEFVVTASMAIMIRKDLNVFRVLLGGWKYYIAGAIMFVATFFIAKYFSPTIWMTILLVVIGIAIYFAILLILREKILLQILKKIFSYLKRGSKNNE